MHAIVSQAAGGQRQQEQLQTYIESEAFTDTPQLRNATLVRLTQAEIYLVLAYDRAMACTNLRIEGEESAEAVILAKDCFVMAKVWLPKAKSKMAYSSRKMCWQNMMKIICQLKLQKN